MTETGPDDRSRRPDPDDEATLAPFFAAARRSEPAPSPALLSAILADAGAVSAARAAPPVPRRAPGRSGRSLRGLLAAFGGWKVATTLVAASAVGFWIGLSGTVELTAGTGLATTAEAQGDPVADFFDLASAE